MHINSMSVLGENKWYDQGDERFHPENIIIDGRNSNILAIISKKQGILSGSWDRILMKVKQRKSWAGLSDSTICT